MHGSVGNERGDLVTKFIHSWAESNDKIRWIVCLRRVHDRQPAQKRTKLRAAAVFLHSSSRSYHQVGRFSSSKPNFLRTSEKCQGHKSSSNGAIVEARIRKASRALELCVLFFTTRILVRTMCKDEGFRIAIDSRALYICSVGYFA